MYSLPMLSLPQIKYPGASPLAALDFASRSGVFSNVYDSFFYAASGGEFNPYEIKFCKRNNDNPP